MKYLIVITAILVFITSCQKGRGLTDPPIDLVSDAYNNIPVRVNAKNSFTYTVSATNLTNLTEEELNFDNDSIVVTITLTNSVSSEGTVKLFDSSDDVFFTEILNSNKIIVRPNIYGKIPTKIMIDLISFTGQLTIVVAVDKL